MFDRIIFSSLSLRIFLFLSFLEKVDIFDIGLLGNNQSVSKMEAYDNTRFTIRVGSKTYCFITILFGIVFHFMTRDNSLAAIIVVIFCL
jgi:hypothetical protein